MGFSNDHSDIEREIRKMNGKISNVCSVLAAMIPLFVLAVSKYTLPGIITWIVSFIALILIMLINVSLEKNSILSRLGWIFFIAIICYSGIMISLYSYRINIIRFLNAFLKVNLGITFILVAIGIITIFVGRMRKRILLAKIFEYFGVISFILASIYFFNLNVKVEFLTVPVMITIGFFFIDYICVTSKGYLMPGERAGISYHIWLAVILNSFYVLFAKMFGVKAAEKVMDMSSISDATLIFAIIGAVIMILITAVFREKSTILNAESSLYVSIAALLSIILIFKNNAQLCLIVLISYAIVTFQFVYYCSEGKLVTTIKEKTKLPVFFQNVAVTLVVAGSIFCLYNDYNFIAFIFPMCILIILMLCALNPVGIHKVLSCGIITSVYILSICFLIENEKLMLSKLVISISCLLIQIMMIIPACMHHDVLIKLNDIYEKEEVPIALIKYRKTKIVKIWIIHFIFCILSIILCIKIIVM